MATVSRLRTFVDVADGDDAGPEARRMSVTARHQAVLTDGRRITLLDERGWSEELRVVGDQRTVVGIRGIWAHETAAEIERTARAVVGPDEPFEGHTQDEMDASHWDFLAGVLRQQGIDVVAADLRALPHDVDLGDRVHARLGHETIG